MLTPLLPGEPSIVDVLEGVTFQYRAVLMDDQTPSQPVPVAALTSLLLTVYVITSGGAIVYLRNDQNVLNANNVTVDASGVLTWAGQVSDTTLVESIPFERHVCLFEWETVAKVGKHELVLVVKNLTAVP